MTFALSSVFILLLCWTSYASAYKYGMVMSVCTGTMYSRAEKVGENPIACMKLFGTSPQPGWLGNLSLPVYTLARGSTGNGNRESSGGHVEQGLEQERHDQGPGGVQLWSYGTDGDRKGN